MNREVEKVLENHYNLWLEVARLCGKDYTEVYENYSDGDDVKAVAFENLGYTEPVNFNCFCCEFTGYNRDDAANRDYRKCEKCPIDWGIEGSNEDWKEPPCCMGLYDDFFDSFDCGMYNQAEDIAEQIAELPTNPIYCLD